MSMKVFDLNCDRDHRFEGWFASAAAFDDQQERKLIECPVCGSHSVRKIPAASRLNLSGSQAPARPEPGSASPAAGGAAGFGGCGENRGATLAARPDGKCRLIAAHMVTPDANFRYWTGGTRRGLPKWAELAAASTRRRFIKGAALKGRRTAVIGGVQLDR